MLRARLAALSTTLSTPLVAAACAALAVVLAAREAWTTDDALITFRYVENLVAGHGLVYNLGERLEALSNVPWALLLAAARLAGVEPFAAAGALGLTAAAVEAALVVLVARRATGSLVPAALAGALFATDRIVVVWSTSGLESSLQGLLVTGALAAALAARPERPARATAAGALLLAAATGRPEGLVVAPPVLLALAIGAPGGGALVRRALNVLLPGAAALLALRYAYYGELLPHAFQAKVEGVPTRALGLGYAASLAERLGLGATPGALATAAVAGLAALGLARGRAVAVRAPLLVALGVAAAGGAAIVVMGGDYMTDFRLARPFVGAFCVALACGVRAASGALEGAQDGAGAPSGAVVRRLAARAVPLLLGLALAASHLARQRDPNPLMADAPAPAAHKRILTVSRDDAARLREPIERFARSDDAILADWSGKLGYGHTLRVIDATGLLSRRIAGDFYLREEWSEEGARVRFPGHARWPRVAFLQRERVTFIFPKVNRRPPEDPEIHPRAQRRTQSYPFLHVTVPLGGGDYLRFFTARDADEILARARERGLAVCVRPPWGALRCEGNSAVR